MFPKIYDHATSLLNLNATAKGGFVDGAPRGITIHYTADDSIETAVKSLIPLGLGYHLIIGRDGTVCQMTSFDKTCWHAGKAVWAGLSPNSYHIAVALVSWGFLTKKDGVYKSYSGIIIPPSDVHYRPDNITGQVQPWQAATVAQIDALDRFLHWSLAFGIQTKHICGHDECALPPGRKQDPGGILPWSMNELRERIEDERLIG